MKNSLNLVLVILFFVVLGCSCPNMEDLAKKIDNSSTSSSPTTSSPSTNSSNSSTKDDANLTLEKYNKINNGMSYKQVVEIIGSEGVEQMRSGSGKYEVTSFKWEGPNYQFVTVIFTGDKVTSKVQYGLK